ncbi:MAG: tetratricopeptide repeat protein [Holosporales bacterium]|jgi:tol-pal system protein YbgF|nr:tetratricopeptide repeat protein [Holosporales bacterium]
MNKILQSFVCVGGLFAFPAWGQQEGGYLHGRIAAMEDDQRALQGQLEELSHIVEGLQKELDRLRNDIDQRFSDLEGRKEKKARPVFKKEKSPVTHEEKEEPSSSPKEGAEHPLEKARAQFNAKNYTATQETINDYLTTRPTKSDRAVAQYWLGEALFAQGHYEEAALAFVTGYKADAQGRRTPETLLKLARALIAAKKHKEARTTLRKLLQDYPNAPAEIREKAEKLVEQKE